MRWRKNLLAIKSEGASREVVPINSREIAQSRSAFEKYLTDFARQAVATYAREAFEETDKANVAAAGRRVAAVVAVNGRKNAQIDAINTKRGTIEFEWEMVDDVLQWIWQALRDRSPVTSGHYRDAHILLADGVPVAFGGKIPQAVSYVFLNTQPYARKLEVGRTESGRAFVIQVPNRIYERTAKEAKGRFDNSASIAFEYIDPPAAYTLQHNQPSRTFLPGRVRRSPTIRKDRRAGSAVPSPAIIVTMNVQRASAGTPQLTESSQPLLLQEH